MAFLQDLRMANIFPRKPATDRPFGMPDIDSGNIGNLLRQILPVAGDMNREPGLNRIATSMRSNRPTYDTAIRGPIGRHSGFDPNTNVTMGRETGPSPTQRNFLAQHEQEQAGDRAERGANINFMRAQDLTRDKQEHEENLVNKEVAAKTSLFDREAGLKHQLADKEIGAKTSLFDREAKLRKDINDATIAGRNKDVITRETLRNQGKENTPKQTADAYKFAAQKLQAENPVLGKLLETDDSGMFKISDKANPEQRKRITAILNDEAYQPPVIMGDEAASPVKRQRNPKTGAIRESRDGGKTWTVISDGKTK